MKRRTKRILLGVGLGGLGVGFVYWASRPSSPRSIHPTGLAFGQDLSPEERAKVVEIGKALDVDPSYLTTMAYAESGISAAIHIFEKGRRSDGSIIWGRSTNPDDITEKTFGGGLIGFTKYTAKGMGTNLWELLHLSRLEQWDWVYEFFRRHRASGTLPANPTLWQIYMSCFLPADIEYADEPNFVLAAKDGRRAGVWKANRAADRNNDGKMTVKEAMARIDGILQKGISKGHVF